MNKKMSSLKVKKLLKQASIFCQTGNFLEAGKIYLELLKTIPSHPEVLANLGTIELQSGNFEKGIIYLKKSIHSNPAQPIIISNLANGLLELGEFAEAIKYYRLALKLDPNANQIFYNLARALKATGRFDEAVNAYQEALKINPTFILAYFNLGSLYNEIGQYNLAIMKFSEALDIQPSNSQLFYSRGIAYDNLKQYDFAIKDYDQAIKIDVNFESAYSNKSGVLTNLNLYQEAIECINCAIKINPNNPINYNKKAFILEEMKDFNGAISNYDQAIKIQPDFSEAKKNKATCKLALNFFREGWLLYEARWLDTLKNVRLKTSKPELLDFKISNKTIYIWGEQGVGDQILYSSLLPSLLNTPNKFIVSVDQRLISLFSRSFSLASNTIFINANDIPSEELYDYHIPIGSLGKICRNSVEDFKNQVVNFLVNDQDQSKFLHQKIKVNNNKICGISWKSKNTQFGDKKSIPLEQLLPILLIPNITFVNLQYGNTSEERNDIFSEYGIEIKSFDEIDNFNDIDSLASLIGACDFIVSVSNVTAHIAGALNKKTYLLLPFSYGKIWYWGEDSDSSLWYPSIQILRQCKPNSWNQAIEDLSNKIIYV
jgi:tetratricopeptide (TPR) repeat protein/ADP-heptose:LPS heptosyltransferase